MEHALTPVRFPGLDDLIRWAFGAATVLTRKGKAMFADRLRTSPGTYTTSPKFLGMGTGAHGAAREAKATDTVLSAEVETRTSGTESTVETTVALDTYQVSGTQTATATREIDEMGTFDASSAGNMCLSATVNTISLASGDSVTWTVKIQQS